MARYGVAASFVLSAVVLHDRRGEAFHSTLTGFQPTPGLNRAPNSVEGSCAAAGAHARSRSRRSVSFSSAIIYDDNSNNSDEERSEGRNGSVSLKNSLRETFHNLSASYLDSLSRVTDAVGNDDDTDQYDEEAKERRRRKTRKVVLEQGQPSLTYKVTVLISEPTATIPRSQSVPASGTGSTAARAAAEATVKIADNDVVNSLGLTLRQVGREGMLSELALDLDSLRFRDIDEENRQAAKNQADGVGSVQVLDSSMRHLIDENFAGVIVSSVVRGGRAWEAGVRAGDTLLATSATLGEKLWPKSTLDGVRSAISSRKLMNPSITLQFRRSGAHIEAAEVVEEFELSLDRPIGIQVEDTDSGQVQISGFTPDASPIVRNSLRIGDRVVAVESSFGGQMWPVSSVDGVVSACTTRLPGQRVKLKFERVIEVGEWTNGEVSGVLSTGEEKAVDSIAPSLSGAVEGFRKLKADTSNPLAQSSFMASTGSKTHRLLLSRCRDVLRRYTAEQANPKFADKYSVPALVADRVLEALADASAPLDGKTLSLIMNAYITCRKPDAAIRAFEASVGLAADGSTTSPDVAVVGKKIEGNRILPDVGALNLFTATALLRAHALQGDFTSARRVLAAMQGQAGLSVAGVKAALWPGFGRNSSMMVDTRCYNIALAAAAKAGSEEAIEVALEIFDSMAEPSAKNDDGRPRKNLVTYNTMISVFAKSGRSQDAFTVFYSMKQARVKPDKFTYTTLVNACVEDGDVRELLYDMKEQGVNADVVTYNTVIKALCDRYKWYEAKTLVTEMESRGIKPDSMTYGLLMSGLVKANKPSAALVLFESAYMDERSIALTDNVQLYTTAITAASTLGDYERALELLSRMTIRGIKPNLKTLTALMGGCLSAGKVKYALKVYKKMDKPDGYAMTLGLRAYCDAGDFGAAAAILTDQCDGHGEMSGKEIMTCYNYMIRSALSRGEYDVARLSLTQLLQYGYIPSKMTFQNILEGLNLLRGKDRKKEMIGQEPQQDAQEVNKFDFLLAVLDAIEKRKVPCSGSFYSAILFEGARLGGLRKKISSLLVEAREHTKVEGNTISSDEKDDEKKTHLTWKSLLEHYDDYKGDIGGNVKLPLLRVRVGSKEIRQVVSAEQGVTYGSRRNRSYVRSWSNNLR